MTLEHLQSEYKASRSRVNRRAVFQAEVPNLTCRYCGRFWRKWKGSQLDGHAKCLVDERFRFVLKQLLTNPKMHYRGVGLALGVSPSVVRAWSFPLRGFHTKGRR